MRELIQMWVAEHTIFKRLLTEIEQQTTLFRRGEAVDYDLMLNVVYYMVEYPDRFHHPAEDVVFKLVAEREGGAKGAVEMLRQEHRVIAESGMALRQQIAAVVNGAVASRIAVVRPAQKYLEFFRRHMNNEESIVFPVAKNALHDSDWELVYRWPGIRPELPFDKSIGEPWRSLRSQIAADIHCGCSSGSAGPVC